MTGRHGRAVAEPLIEREAHFEVLLRQLKSLRAGRSTVTMVEGPPGSGRSALLRWLTDRAGEKGIPVAAAQGSLTETGSAWGVLSQLAEPMRAATGPLLVTVDDVQFADFESLCRLHLMARCFSELPVLLLLAARSPAFPVSTGQQVALRELVDTCNAGGEVLTTAVLSLDGVRATLAARYGPGVDEETVLAVHTVTRGCPTVLRAVTEQFALTGLRAADRTRLRAVAAEETGNLFVRMVEVLPGDLVDLVRAIAVCGGQLGYDLVCRVAGFRDGSGSLALVRLRAAGLVTGDERPELADPVAAERLLAVMSTAAREKLHLRAVEAGWLAAIPDEALAEMLLWVRVHGAPWSVAVLRDAAAASHAGGDPATAVKYLQRALAEPMDAVSRAQVRIELGAAQLHHAPRASGRNLGEVIRSPGGAEVDELRVQAADLLLARGDLTLVHRLTRAPLGRMDSGSGGGAALSALHRLTDEGKHEWAEQPVCEVAPGPPHPAEAGVRAWQLSLGGEDIERVRELARIGVSPDTPPFVPRILACFALCLTDDLDEAVAGLDSVVTDALRPGADAAVALALATRAGVDLRRGRTDGAADDLDRASRLMPDDSWHPRFALVLRLAWARLHLRLDETELAARSLDGPVPSGTEDGVLWPQWLLAKGVLNLRRGAAETADAQLSECGRRLLSAGVHNPAAVPWRAALATAKWNRGAGDEAVRLITEEHRLAARWGAVGATVRARRLLSPVHGETTAYRRRRRGEWGERRSDRAVPRVLPPRHD
ncbi:hypothetical protein BS329_20430 [Amycolatopsis coloradensis]|uniref:Orc1-like AAA ATPase domain-containing protein n=1 Tax=Amycolatopsis coloradensis TaxID=76021 RepID=A0A1R0KQN9_9PSEU|nr:ATP-binding protein [Amycolatopsis coloradensis]OLZ50002.1 hypothetical protein BS329_20430 [Amycolatopsis coloradensis]